LERELTGRFRYRVVKSEGLNPWNGKELNKPANNGFDTNYNTTLQSGERIDRYRHDGGRYTSPEGTPFGERSLHPSQINDTYSRFEVLKPINVEAGRITPYYFQRGGGIQFKTNESIKFLIKKGYLKK
jgi:hypothetical protein